MALQHTYEFEAIGTPWSIDTARPLTAPEKQSIQTLIEDFDAIYSRFRTDSLVSQARRQGPGRYAFPDSIVLLYDTYARLERATKGAVNPLVGEALEHLGYDAQYSLKPATTAIQKPRPLAQAVARVDTTLIYSHPALLDVGAIGKGYLVDAVAAHIAQTHANYVVEAGGDMRIATNTPYVVGLEDPSDPTSVIGAVPLQDKSICASSPNRRSWGNGLHHIIDARSGQPAVTDIVATWAIAPTTTLADALTTALFFAQAADLQKVFGDFEYIIVKRDGRVEHNIAV